MLPNPKRLARSAVSARQILDSAGGVRTLLALAFVLVLALAFRIHFFVGIVGSDDLIYWSMASALADGDRVGMDFSGSNSVASTRYGFLGPLAFLFWIFGSSWAAAFGYTMAWSLIGVAIAWDLVRRLTGSLGAATIAGAALALQGIDIALASLLWPDGPMAAQGLAALYCFVLALHASGGARRRAAALFVSAGFLAGFSVASKETGAFYAAAMGLWGLWAIGARAFPLAALLVIPGFLAALSLDLIAPWVMYGDPWLHGKMAYETVIEAGGRSMGATQPDLMEMAGAWLGQSWSRIPATLVETLLGLAGAAYLMWTRPRDQAARLMTLAIVIFVLLRIPELFVTSGRPPRRMLPGAQIAIVLIVWAAWTAWRRASARSHRVSWNVERGLALAGVIALGFHALDYKYVQGRKKSLDVLWGIEDWHRRSEPGTSTFPVYTDYLTARQLNALLFHRLKTERFRPYPRDWPSEGYWLLNPAALRRIEYRRRVRGAIDRAAAYPESWTLEAVLPRPAKPGGAIAILRIRPGADRSARLRPAWGEWSRDGNLAPEWQVDAPPTAAFEPSSNGGLRLRLQVSGIRLRSAPITWEARSGGFEGPFILRLSVLRAEPDKDAIRVEVEVTGIADGGRNRLAGKSTRTFSGPGILEVTVPESPESNRFQIAIRAREPGLLEFAPLEVVPSLREP